MRALTSTYGLLALGTSWLAITGIQACGADASSPTGILPSPATQAQPSGSVGDAAVAAAGDASSASPPTSGANPSVSGVTRGPDPTTCQQLTVGTGRVTPDILIVLDRSSSMKGIGIDRWTPSIAAIKAISAELDEVIRFGLMVFPGRGASAGGFLGGGGMSCAAGTLEVPIGIGTAPAIASRLDALTLVQSTPTATTLEAAHGVLGSGKASLDGVTADKYVVLVTDGAPNCGDGAQPGPGANDAAAVTASVNAIAAMKNDGIKTFVLGYDTQSDPALKAALDQMAGAGGTGDTQHRAIENEAGLVAQLRGILGVAISCEFSLASAPSDPNYVSVQLDASKLQLGQPNGFVLGPDRRTLMLQGSACAMLQNPKEHHMLSVRVECERQTPLL